MKPIHHLALLALLIAAPAAAQPPARQREAAAQASATSAAATPTASPSKATKAKSSVREFPTAQTMPQDAAWRRDIYRRIDLRRDANAPLYYPIFPQRGRKNLFVHLFHLILRGQIKAYEYTRDANEHFDEAHIVKGKKIMDENRIFYETVDGKLRLNDADLPSEDVKAYFLKESVYYDQHTATFRTRVAALCPVVVSGTSEFGESEQQQIPLFWVNYDEAAPHLAKIPLMGSNLNNAAEISADDFFATNRYEGDIYKTTNLQDRVIAQYAPTDSAARQERTRIEDQLRAFEDHVWGTDDPPADNPTPATAATPAPTDSTTAPAPTKITRRTTRRRAADSTTPAATTAKPPKVTPPAPAASARPTLTVRRQRR